MNQDEWVKNGSLEEILAERDKWEVGSSEWESWNETKGLWLEYHKPSTKEEIVYFAGDSLSSIPDGFSPCNTLPVLSHNVMRRSLLEYHPEYRHPIPYVIIRHKRRYFFILRQSGSGEQFLVGLMGLVGGHVGAEDLDELSLNKTILNGLRRELNEEVGISDSMIRSVDIKGLIKGYDGVDAYHLGVVYEIELETDDIMTQEEGVIEGLWVHENKLSEYVDRFESWAKMVYDHLLV